VLPSSAFIKKKLAKLSVVGVSGRN